MEQAMRWVSAVFAGEVRLLRFLLVGLLNTLVGYSVFCLMIWLGLHYSVASAVATVLGVAFNFKSTGKLVFGCNDDRRIVRFVLVYVIIYCVNVIGLALLLRLGIEAYAGAIVLILPLALLAYCLNTLYVFDTNDQTP
ncbi:GtrA family protein [Agrobacterium sp. Azo12]|uniref:GtrA family protein n=1 Tax=Agrobacterium sp. Azo12 TaxID=3031129 RepID=UPI0023D8A258|nr:GtrA family protein [Agrobacterium sp. Azo12]MDO5896964.1 GtrA family protein [Agrobacterium sp. Azo12]